MVVGKNVPKGGDDRPWLGDKARRSPTKNRSVASRLHITARLVDERFHAPVIGVAQHESPFHAAMPSWSATAAITDAAIGSPHQQSSDELSSRPINNTADR